MAERFKSIDGILNIILKDGKVLMILRNHKFDSKLFSLPGGCMEEGETVAQAAIREIKEEVDLDVKVEDVDVISVMHRITPWNWHSSEYVAVVTNFSGEPRIVEKYKCTDLQWFDLENLPENISAYAKEAISNYINNIHFKEITV